MKSKKRRKNKQIRKLQAKSSAWAFREYMKLHSAKLPDSILSQIEQHRMQKIKKVKYEPDRIVVLLG